MGKKRAVVGALTMLVGENNGMATDFGYANDAKRVAVKTVGAVVESGLDSFYQNAGTSPKMVWDSAGVLVWAPHNLILQSEDFTSASWSKGAGATAPSAHVGSDTDAAQLGFITQGVTTIAGASYTTSLWFKKDGAVDRFPAVLIVGTGQINIQINTNTGAMIGIGSNTLPSAVASVEDITTHWKVKISFVADAASTTVRWYPAHGVTFGTSTVAAVGSATVDKVQVNRGAVALAYLQTTTAARFGLAVDYDPVSHNPRGMLSEPTATNFLIRSTEFDSVSWTKGAATTGVNVIVGPNGQLDADALIPNAGVVSPFFQQGIGSGLTIGQPYTFSAFVKNGTLGTSWLDIAVISSTTWRAWFNLSTGIKGTSASSPVSWNMVSVGNGWYRVDVTVIAGAASMTIYFQTCATDGGLDNITGDGVKPSFYAWGAQVEPGTFQTSFVPTFVATVVRSADNNTALLNTIPALGSEYSIYCRYAVAALGTSRYAVALCDGTTAELTGIGIGASNSFLTVVDNNVTQCTLSNGTLAVGALQSGAGRIKALDFAYSAGGTAVGTNVAGSSLPTPTQIRFGNNGTTLGALTPVWISKLAIVTDRGWDNATLTTKSLT